MTPIDPTIAMPPTGTITLPSADVVQRFAALWHEIVDVRGAVNMLQWDQETMMPTQGQPARAATLATLAALEHRLLTAPALQDALDGVDLLAMQTEDKLLSAHVRVARREIVRATRIPERLAREMALAQSDGLMAWKTARLESDFDRFAPRLKRLVALRREEAAAVMPDAEPYDALLDHYEPAMTGAMLEPLFDQLRAFLTPRVQAIAERGVTIDESCALGDFPPEDQLRLSRTVAAWLGYDFDAGRLDESAHPFCIGIATGDVRMTWRWQPDDFRPALLGILHELGHALYEQGLRPDLRRMPAGVSVSLGIHESQSRLWENHVGRSHGFWRWLQPHLRKIFPMSTCDADAMWRGLHVVRPSLIRVDADQVTYNLHIALRFDLERRLFSGDLQVADLPAAWNDGMEALLGVRPKHVAEGVLQDVHWAHGMFGYFPT
ncbi:MAG: carboxypeptidase M32, partial [Acidobacteriota bacterium]